MKLPVLLLIFFAAVSISRAFSPAGPPPVKTVHWTVDYSTLIEVPRVHFTKDTSLAEGLEFLQLRHVMPAAYGIEIDGSALGEERLKKPFEIQMRGKKLIEILATIADGVDADLVVGSGKISLVPKDKSGDQKTPVR